MNVDQALSSPPSPSLMDLEKDDSLPVKAEDAVKQLYKFSLNFIKLRGEENAATKWKEVKVQMEETVDLLDSLKGSLPKEMYWGLKGRSLNVMPDHSAEAEDYLARAIKHDPGQLDTWNALGESYWKAGKVQQAHDCFAGALAHSKNKESLRNLSMVLRQIGKDENEREAKVKESLERAKEAVAMDVKDGMSWMILGNAYLALFFLTGQDSKVLRQCYTAYSHAEKDPVLATNPDLHFNRSTLYHYEEKYQDMLEELDRSLVLDPDWSTPRDKVNSTLEFLNAMAALISSKGKVKAKILLATKESLSSPGAYLAGREGGKSGEVGVVIDGNGRRLTRLADLKEGANVGSVVVAGVVSVVSNKEAIPHGCVVLDKDEFCLGLTVYNLASSVQFSAGKVLTIPDPLLKSCCVRYKGQEVLFQSVRVTDPAKILVNGEPLKSDKLAPSVVTVTAFS